jgi:nucleoside-diphosphate-sugar epimerase
MSRSALVTGVTGFVGGKLAERLLGERWAVHALLRETSSEEGVPSGVSLHRHDGSVEGLTGIVAATKPDVVFHLASLYLADHRADQVDALIASNIGFPAQLAEAMTAAGATRLINTGTAWQHFEGQEYNPVNLYAATKQAALDLLRYYHEARGLSVLTLKLFDTYGAGDKRRKLVQLLVDAASSGERLGMSAGEQVIDLTHVDDVVAAFAVAAERLMEAGAPLREEFFVSGERMSVVELVGLVGDVLEAPIDARLGERPYRPREVMQPVRVSARDVLPGWARKTSLRERLATLLVG